MNRYQVKTIMNAHTQDDRRFTNEQDARAYYESKRQSLAGWRELGTYKPSAGDTITLLDLADDRILNQTHCAMRGGLPMPKFIAPSPDEIKRARAAAGWSQVELAGYLIGYSDAQIQEAADLLQSLRNVRHWESGAKAPSRKHSMTLRSVLPLEE